MTTLPTQKVDDPRGWLTFNAPLPDDLQRGEDSTQWSDFRQRDHVKRQSVFDKERRTWIDYFVRPSTPTEKTLLGMLGYTVPDDLTTVVSFPTPLVRRRRWPALETD